MTTIAGSQSYSDGAATPPVWMAPDPALAAAGIEGEVIVSQVRLLAMGLLMISPTVKILQEPGDPVYLTGYLVTVAATVVAFGIWAALRVGRWRPWIGFGSSIFDVSMISTALVSFLIVLSPVAALMSNVTFEMYFLAILATSLRYDARICIVAGGLALLQYGGMWAWSATHYQLDRQIYRFDSAAYAPVDLFTRLILLSIATILAVTIVRRAQRLLYLAARDRLTGLFNRGHFDRTLSAALEATVRAGQPLSLAILDIDHFKQVNDVHGHALGDHTLCEVAERLREAMRRTDMVARYGGEEFVILMPGTPREAALLRMEALRQETAAIPVDLGGGQSLTINFSAGIAGTPADAGATTPKGLLTTADARLLAAKRAGRGRCVGTDR